MSNRTKTPTKRQIRRRIVNTTLLFCASVIGYLTVAGNDTQLHNTIANGLIFLSATTIGSYIFGRTWEDKNAGTRNN